MSTNEHDFDPVENKAPIARDDVRSAYLSYKDKTFNYFNEIYKNHYMRTKDRETQLIKEKQERKTNIRAPITHMFASGMHNLLLQADLNFVAMTNKIEKQGIIDEITDRVDYIVSSEDTMDTFHSSSFDATLL